MIKKSWIIVTILYIYRYDRGNNLYFYDKGTNKNISINEQI